MKKISPEVSASRSKNRMSYDAGVIQEILDEALVCTVSYTKGGKPRSLPTGHVRTGNRLYIHGSVKSHFFNQMAAADTVCITAFLLRGLVLAKSGLNHSFNYRSAVIFSRAFLVDDDHQKYKILADFTDRYTPGRWAAIRKPTQQEMDATMILGFDITEASAKVRQGPPNDLDKDKQLPVWSGVIPLETRWLQPQPDENSTGYKTPDHIRLLCMNGEPE